MQQTIALSIREDGIVPPFSKVTKAQIITELRRRGAMVSAKTKIGLYEALHDAVLSAKAGTCSVAEAASEAASQPWKSEETGSDTKASLQNESFARAFNVVSDLAYNPAAATVVELSGILQALKVPYQGRKAELLERVYAYRAALEKDTGSFQSSVPVTVPTRVFPDKMEKASDEVAGMTDTEVEATLTRAVGKDFVQSEVRMATQREWLQVALMKAKDVEQLELTAQSAHTVSQTAHREVGTMFELFSDPVSIARRSTTHLHAQCHACFRSRCFPCSLCLLHRGGYI